MNAVLKPASGMAQAASVSDLIRARKPNHMMPADFYLRDDILALDLDVLFKREWLFAGVAADIPEPGDAFTMDVGSSSIVIIRDDDGVIRAVHNVCRHRGSRILPPGRSNVAKLVCPYHQWTYELDGSLLFAKNMGSDFKRVDHALKPVAIREVGGLLMINLADDPPTEGIDEFERIMQERLAPFDLNRAKVAAEDAIVENANWKLTTENNRECYHCPSGHPELTRSFPAPATTRSTEGLSDDDAADFHAYQAAQEALHDKCEALGFVGRRHVRQGDDKDLYFSTERFLISGPGESATMDGKVACRKLLGNLQEKAQGDVHLWLVNAWFHFYSDHAVCISVEPLAVDRTRVRTQWLVHEDAVAGDDYDLDDLTRVWKATNGQDAAFVERQQHGVADPAYVPGLYSPLTESGVDEFTRWYLGRLRAAGY